MYMSFAHHYSYGNLSTQLKYLKTSCPELSALYDLAVNPDLHSRAATVCSKTPTSVSV